MGCPGIGPCEPWDLDLSCCLGPSGGLPDPCFLDGEPVPQDVIDSAVLAASQFMWRKTGMQFGCCQVTIHPCEVCPSNCPDSISSYGDYWGYPWYPIHLANGDWTNVSCPCEDSCLCGSCRFRLPYPVCSVDEVIIDGEVLPNDSYRVDNFTELVLLDPDRTECWKGCNNSITLTYGRPVPELVLKAAAILACEFIKFCQGRPCSIPQRVTSISRQGMSATFLDPMEFMSEGKTGIYLVDLAIMTYNPKGLYKKAAIYSPDSIRRYRVETWRPGDPTGPQCT